MDPFLSPIQNEMERVEEGLDAALQSDVELAHEVARYMATLKGKRLRPALVLLGAKATKEWDERIIDAAVAIEMIHAATMIHDDVVDSAAMRRGRASVNSVWSGQVAVLMGDFLLARALCILVSLGNLGALQTVARATERLSQGEILEIHIGLQTDTREASYFSMVADKTASLIGASCKLGPILTGASSEIVDAMGKYGESLGLAFQIADDILDFTGDASVLGKPVGHDLREDKITLPLIRALTKASNDERASMQDLLQQKEKSENDWKRIVAFVETYDGVHFARETARNCGERALKCLQVLAPSQAREVLEMAVRLVVEREN